MRTAFVVVLLTTAFGCAPKLAEVTYSLPLVSARRSPDGVSAAVAQADSGAYRFRDDQLEILVAPRPSTGVFDLTIENLTGSSLELIWDRAAYVDPTGVTSRLVRGETRVIDIERSNPPSLIPAGAKLAVVAVPAMNLVEGSSANYMRPFVPRTWAAGGAAGKEIRLLLPIQAAGQTREYTLTFRVGNVTFWCMTGSLPRPCEARK
jgi:hypothetical protein